MKQKRNLHARHESIVNWVVQHGQTPVETLAREFSTSEVTIRKDLTLLAEQGRLIRQHGGAAPLNKPQPATNTQLSLKQAIGQLAASLVNDSHKIVIDSGSTTATMVEHLKQPSQLVVMTNSLNVANQLVTFDNEPTVLIDCEVADNAVIEANSIVEQASVGESCTVGPYGRLRPGAVMERGAKVGNFVEMKKARLGEGAKANHLTYLGDADIGAGSNIGAGTITCNYDGVNKSKTLIGENAFIGSNSALVAPVEIGAGATVAAGSIITAKVPDDALAVARSKQRNIAGWQRPKKK